MDRVTKTKHPGRVAQGHKLVTLNRERKAALKEQSAQQPEQQPTQQSAQQPEQQPTQQPEQQPTQQHEQQLQTPTVVYGGALAIVAVIGVALYIYRKKPAPPSSVPSNNDDIFCMN